MQHYRNNLSNWYNKMKKNLNNQGFIDRVKKINNIRFIASNPNGFRPENSEKIEMLY